jgi:hypothetical protein
MPGGRLCADWVTSATLGGWAVLACVKNGKELPVAGVKWTCEVGVKQKDSIIVRRRLS